MNGNAFAGSVLVLLSAILFAPAFVAAGSEFDEGILVTFPVRVLHGDLPYRDFETFYGPAQPFLTAGVFDVFGSTLGAERAIGLCFRLVLVLGVYVLLQPFGRTAAFAGGFLTAIVLAAGGVTFDSEVAAQALAVVALSFAWRSLRRGSDKLLAGGGFAAGLAGLFRPEAAPLIVFALVPLLVRRGARPLLLGAFAFGIALAPYVPLAVAAGGRRLERGFDDLVATRQARRLPITFASDAAYLLTGLIVALLLLAIATIWRLRDPAPRSRLLCSLGVYGTLLIPYALWRADAPHVAYAGVLVFAAVPAAAAELSGRRANAGACLAAGAVLAFFLGIHYIRGGVSRNAKLALGLVHSHVVSYAGRGFRIDDPRAAWNLQHALAVVGRLTPRGGSLFVGPTDLRRTNGNDVFVYYLFPHLRPASFYVELDPPASKRGSGLARALVHADALLLGSRWNRQAERNGSRHFGSAAPNLVVHHLFCRRAAFGGYEVLTPCRRGGT